MPNAEFQAVLRKEGWEGAWKGGWEAGWSTDEVTPALATLLASDRYPTLNVGRALVPGSGKGHDVLLLAATPGRETVVGLDVTSRATEAGERLRTEWGVDPRLARFETGDFFAYDGGGLPFDVVYDHTFLCALPPGQRKAWADKMAGLVRPEGFLVAYMFPLSDHEGGPPWALSIEVYRELLGETFEEEFVEEVGRTFKKRANSPYGEKLSLWRRRAA
ncbi:hypothetical protein HKX48_002231 [Thoreauomyces humboldtii]|nr:hypothetical protein HKX48_002231 [Thoreauomyces humboldtii]